MIVSCFQRKANIDFLFEGKIADESHRQLAVSLGFHFLSPYFRVAIASTVSPAANMRMLVGSGTGAAGALLW